MPHSLGSDGDICSQANNTCPAMAPCKKQKTILLKLETAKAQPSSACNSNKDIQGMHTEAIGIFLQFLPLNIEFSPSLGKLFRTIDLLMPVL